MLLALSDVRPLMEEVRTAVQQAWGPQAAEAAAAAAEDPAAEAAAEPAPDVKTSDVKTSAAEHAPGTEKQELAIRYKHMALHTDTDAWGMTFSEQLKRTRGAQSSLSAKQLHES